MKALVYTAPQTLVFRDEPEPTRLPGDSLVRVEAVGICGSDMHAYLGHDDRRPAPLILGHEAMGVAQEGAFADKPVVINPLVTCGECKACLGGRSNLCARRQIMSIAPRQGGFAEYLAIPDRNMVEVPSNLSAAQAALAEPMATGWHAVAVGERLSQTPLAEAEALVIGGGAIGVSVALALRARGCAAVQIAETNALRRNTVAGLRLGSVFDPTAEDAPGENVADLVVDCVGGGRTRELASQAARPGALVVHVGLQNQEAGLDVRKLTLQEITFVGTYTYTMDDFRATVAAMAAGELGALDWFEERPLSDGAQAFDDLLGGRTGAAKVVLKLRL